MFDVRLVLSDFPSCRFLDFKEGARELSWGDKDNSYSKEKGVRAHYKSVEKSLKPLIVDAIDRSN